MYFQTAIKFIYDVTIYLHVEYYSMRDEIHNNCNNIKGPAATERRKIGMERLCIAHPHQYLEIDCCMFMLFDRKNEQIRQNWNNNRTKTT